MEFYNLDKDKVLEKLESSELGISNDEALIRKNKYGLNKLMEKKKKSNLVKFLSEFKDLMIIILIISSIVSFIISVIEKDSYVDSIVIILIVILNAILGFVQELKADKAIDSLKKMQSSKVKVKRDSKNYSIDSSDVTIGDILVLEAGDTVPADARVIWEVSLKVDESSLTGESLPVHKSVDKLDGEVSLSERCNMIYSGTNISYGKCLAVVTNIGMDTEFGHIAKSLNSEIEDEMTPLQVKINEISKVLSLIIMIVIIIMFIFGIIKGMEIKEVILLSISLAVAAIPEGLPAVITIILSLGMTSMAKKKAIVRRMSSVETLGCTEIICSDKTGTITQNKMTIREIYFDNKLYLENEVIEPNLLTDIMALNNDSTKVDNDYLGDPTEIALYSYCEKIYNVEGVRIAHSRIGELPFDSDRKLMSTVNVYEDSCKFLTKGSFDSLIKKCDRVYDNGKVIKLTKEKKEELKNIEVMESNKAFRVLAYAYKDFDKKSEITYNEEDKLIFIGFTCMMDPPRSDVKESIELCKSAHIKPIMITGDSLDTAKAIAKEIGILENDDEAILGIDLDKYSEDELVEVVKKYSVYARVSPTNKLNIVNAWKKNNKIVAMTGDGVNDAPALKTADIGVGMGITGTEVSKGVSDIILSDDSFSTIVTAVKEGRRIYDNIRKVLLYLLTGNITEVLVVFICMIFSPNKEIFLPIQLLYINLITDSIPAISLAFEKEQKDVMTRDVRKKDSSFFTPFLITKMVLSSIFKTATILTLYFVTTNLHGPEVGSTMAFLTLITLEMIYAYSCRNLKESFVTNGLFGNSNLNRSTLILIVCQLVVFISPIKHIFKIADLTLLQVGICISICLIVFLIDEFVKTIISKRISDN